MGVYIIYRTLHGRLEIQNFSSRVIFQHSKRNFVSPRSHVISSIYYDVQAFQSRRQHVHSTRTQYRYSKLIDVGLSFLRKNPKEILCPLLFLKCQLFMNGIEVFDADPSQLVWKSLQLFRFKFKKPAKWWLTVQAFLATSERFSLLGRFAKRSQRRGAVIGG